MTNVGRRSKIRHVRDREAKSTEKQLERAGEKNLKKLKKGVDKRNELRYTNEAVPQNGDSKHLENYIVHQQTSQVNSDRKIENNGRERNTTKRKK